MVNADKEYGFVSLKIKRPIAEKLGIITNGEGMEGITLSELIDIIISDEEIMELKIDQLKAKHQNAKQRTPYK